MGYNTKFNGGFEITPSLEYKHKNYLNFFRYTRRMKRDAAIAETLPDQSRLDVDLPIGQDGCFYVGSHLDGTYGQTNDKSVVDYNNSGNMPSLWCQWTPSEDGSRLEWDGGEKFYNYTGWLQFLITNFFEPWGYKLNGTVDWHGEDSDDFGKIIIENNNMTIKNGRIIYE